jgi:uncharacterized protein
VCPVMKIVVISDTHMPKKAKQLPERLLLDLENCDYIIHAGDWQSVELYNELQQYGTVIGVTGNVDGPELKGLLKTKEIFRVGEFQIGVVHGHGTGKQLKKGYWNHSQMKRSIALFMAIRIFPS